MTKYDITQKISDSTGISQKDVTAVLTQAFDLISGALKSGEFVELRHFGTFRVKTRKQMVGRNPYKPAGDIVIPARAAVKFKPCAELKAAVIPLTNCDPPPRAIRGSKPRTEHANGVSGHGGGEGVGEDA